MLAIAESKEAAAGDLPDGLHHRRGVEYLAAAAGMEPDHIGAVVIFDQPEKVGFSEVTAFIKSSNGRGYYMTTEEACTCPSFRFRGGPCKHQKILSERLERKARIDERNRKRAEERENAPKPTTSSRGFNQPETLAVAPL